MSLPDDDDDDENSPVSENEKCTASLSGRSQLRLAPAYVNGVLTLKSSLLSKNNNSPALANGRSGGSLIKSNQNPSYKHQYQSLNSGNSGYGKYGEEADKSQQKATATNLRNLGTAFRPLSRTMINMNYGHQMEPFKSLLDERDETNENIGKSYSYESNANPLYMPAKPSSLSYQQYPAAIIQPQQDQMSAPMSYAPLAMQTDRQANRYVQEFPPHFLFQPPFVPMQTTALETPETPQSIAPQQQPTAEQLDLLQQLSEFFGQRQQQQQQQHPQQQQQNFIPISFAQLASTQPPPDEQGQCPFDTEEITTTISPLAKSTKKSKTTTMEPDESVTIDVESDTEKPISKTKSNKKLPCCSKTPKRDVISFTLNVENPNLNREQQNKAREQQRSSRHAIQPDLRINAIATLLRYRNELGNAQDPLQQLLRQEQKRVEQQQAIKQRRKGKVKGRRQRRILDKNRLLQAELKIWPLKIERLSGV
ncbi:uncharacterized protein Dwil_GK19283 [Drosophila willistoni]|uniref:Uncharacterized protein n=1 Tax=Drosophila willistoni TaxID=7260 RepID=B4ML81_DROWI|nr:uncharacterized protein Dwil_GK19283 [Drosophila willistoni]